ncbi:phage protein F-like protein [Limosilactobacillus coleohominis DSM 14060]|nr:phage protein F-like protein [Limosilactobacillus coleohominis DSM 14060]
MTKNSRYWEERAKKEREWQEAQLKNDESFNKILHEHYNQALVDIDRDIDAQFNRLAKANRSTVEEARKAVSQADIQAYQTEAKKVVDEANKMRAAKKTPTYNDWDDEVNERMRIYNATMRINRLEYLKSQIGLEMVRAGYRIDDDLQAKLAKDYTDELKRQASILGASMKGSLWTSKEVQMQIMAQTNGATFSQRLWQNQDALKARLDAVLNLGIIEGSSNAEMARRVKYLIKDTVTNHQYVAERIARTESTRVQHAAQLKSLKDNGYEYCKWYAEPGACKFCVEIAETDEENIEPGIYTVKDVPMVPVHPNCRCSIGAYVPDEAELGKAINLPEKSKVKINNYNDFENAVKQRLGIRELFGLDKVSANSLQKVYDSLNNNFERFPVLKGRLVKLEGFNKRNSTVVAEYVPGNQSFKINTRIIDKFDNVLHMNVNNGFWTKKHDFTGVINHEFGHFVQVSYPEISSGVIDSYESREMARRWGNNIIRKAIERSGEPLVRETVVKHCSKYGQTDDFEMFAEYFSNEDYDDKVIVEFNKVLDADTTFKKVK